MDHLHTYFILVILFCSPWPSAGTAFLTHLETQCLEDCKPDGGEYKCKTIDKDGRSQTMYCSPQENMDYWGRQCRADSVCGKHGEDYSWCRISIFSWGYCGLVKDDKIIESGEGTIITSRHRNKREKEEEIGTVNDKVNKLKITFSAVPALKDIIDGNTWKDEAEDLINQWNNGKLRTKGKSELIKTKHFRIDMQGTFKRNNQLYYNLQIQINNQSGKTTVSQIIVPDGVPEEHMRRAFRESFTRRARVFIKVSELQ